MAGLAKGAAVRVAVTGAGGFVGGNLVRHLAAAGQEVVAIDRPGSLSAVVGDGQHVTAVAADVLDPEAMRQALAGAEVVYHLAARITLRKDDDTAWDLNTRGVATVARAALAAGVRRFVHCSSVHAFDETRCGPRLDESSPRATAADLPVYDRSKYAGERALTAVIDEGLDASIGNPTGIFGPADPPGRLSRLNAMVLDGALGRAVASVAGSFDLVDVRDVVDGLVRIGESGRTGENYLLPGSVVSMHELLTASASLTGRRAPLLPVPLGLLRVLMPLVGPVGRGLGSDIMAVSSLEHLAAAPAVDGTKARTELGWVPRPFRETVRDLVVHLIRTGALVDRGRRLTRG